MAEDLSKLESEVEAILSAYGTVQSNLATTQGLLTASEAEVETLKAQLAAVPADNQPAVDALAAKIQAALTPAPAAELAPASEPAPAPAVDVNGNPVAQ